MQTAVIRDGQFNIGHICSRFQCDLGLGGKTTLRWLGAHDERTDYTFGDLERQSSRFANVLQEAEFSSGEVFFIFLPKMPEVYFAFLGALKARLVTGTLFLKFRGRGLARPPG
jgi:acetyl-CoA synthetase